MNGRVHTSPTLPPASIASAGILDVDGFSIKHRRCRHPRNTRPTYRYSSSANNFTQIWTAMHNVIVFVYVFVVYTKCSVNIRVFAQRTLFSGARFFYVIEKHPSSLPYPRPDCRIDYTYSSTSPKSIPVEIFLACVRSTHVGLHQAWLVFNVASFDRRNEMTKNQQYFRTACLISCILSTHMAYLMFDCRWVRSDGYCARRSFFFQIEKRFGQMVSFFGTFENWVLGQKKQRNAIRIFRRISFSKTCYCGWKILQNEILLTLMTFWDLENFVL